MAVSLMSLKTRYPDLVRQTAIDILWKSSRLLPLLNIITFKGLAYHYKQDSTLPAVSFRSLNNTFSVTKGITNPASETLAVFGGKTQTDTVMTEVKGPDVAADDTTRMLQAAAKFFDKNFINGDSTVNPLAFTGIKARIGSGSSQMLTNNANGASPDHKKVVALLDAVEGDNAGKVLIMNRNARRGLSFDVGANAGGRNVMDVGQQLTTFEGARIFELFKDETETDILQFNETCGSSNACSSIYCVRPGGTLDEDGVQVISGMDDVFKKSGPFEFGEYVQALVQALIGLGVFNGYSIGRLQGVTAV